MTTQQIDARLVELERRLQLQRQAGMVAAAGRTVHLIRITLAQAVAAC